MAVTTIEGLGPIPSFTGDLPVWRRLLKHTPDPRDGWFEWTLPSKTVRTWVREAAAYHDVPHALAAAILQQENGTTTSLKTLAGQFAEREIQSFFADQDESEVLGSVSGGSSGIANMSRATLRGTDDYIRQTYRRPAVPAKIKALPRMLKPELYTKDAGVKLPFTDIHLGARDKRIPGQDMRVDIYYMAGHLRQLIDRKKGRGQPYSGPLTLDDVALVAAGYNGSGKAALKYGQDCVARLKRAAEGTEPLYFHAEASAE